MRTLKYSTVILKLKLQYFLNEHRVNGEWAKHHDSNEQSDLN